MGGGASAGSEIGWLTSGWATLAKSASKNDPASPRSATEQSIDDLREFLHATAGPFRKKTSQLETAKVRSGSWLRENLGIEFAQGNFVST
jgi:hypothetical protein